MRLYLCSYRIPAIDSLIKLVGKKVSDIDVAIIPNAKDYYAERARNFKINETVKYLEGLGFNTSVLDLSNCDSAAIIKQHLEGTDLIWVSGGNTFCLRHQMQRSGFNEYIKNALDNDEIVYAGESAGACVVGKSLKGIEVADEPEFADEKIWEGLNILPKFILPHVDNPMFADDVANSRQLYSKNELIELKDTEALVVNGSEQNIVSAT